MKKYKYGIIGCGGITNGKHMPAIAKLKEVEMVAFCDIIPERAEKANKDFGGGKGKVYTDYREMLKSDLDAVVVGTPNCSHCEITVAAAAPVTPMSKVKMKSGSSATFSTPPAAMPNIE